MVFPPAWAARVTKIFEDQSPLVSVPNPFENGDGRLGWVRTSGLARNLAEDLFFTKLALEIEAELRPDILMVLLPGIDRVSHRLWGSLEPPELYPERLRFGDEREEAAEALRGYYAYVDALIGKLLERYGPEDLAIVLSDHGFEGGTGKGGLFKGMVTGQHSSIEALHGVFFARGPGVPAGDHAGELTVDDVTPTILTWLGLPVAEDMDGRTAPFLDVKPRPPIATYDTGTIERLEDVPSRAEQEQFERLRALGYIE